MTQRQAWLYLAEKWDNAHDDGDGNYFASSGTIGAYGLCPMIDFGMRVKPDVRKSMLKKISAIPFMDEPYRFPTDKSGARQRASFCRKMARKLTKKKAS